MTTAQFLSHLRETGIRVWVEEGRLRIGAAKGLLSQELRDQLAARKEEIMEILGATAASASREAPPLTPLGRDGLLPLSFAQERLWFLHEYEPGSTAYNIATAWRFSGPLDVSALQRGLAEIVRRHEILRTTLRVREGTPCQVIAAPNGLAHSVMDLTSYPAPEREAEASRRLADLCEQPMDLAAGPLFRAVLAQLDIEDHVLLVRVHHAVFDGWSMGILHQELSALYAAFRDGRSSALPPLAVQYADFATWQRQWLRGQELRRQLDYWCQRLRGAPALELPSDRPRPARQTYRGARHAFGLPRELAARLQSFNRAEGTTPFMSLMAAFAVLLFRYSGAEDLVVGIPIANRRRVELERLIGFFANTLAIRCDLSGSPSFRQLLARVRQTALEAYDHQDLPLEKLVEELNPPRDQSRHPLFQTLLAVQNTPERALQLAGLNTSPFPLPGASTAFDLELYLWPREDGWIGHFRYSTDLFDPATIQRMATHYLNLLDGLLSEPDLPVSRLGILAEVEKREMLELWNATARDYLPNKCVHHLFEEQVLRTPDTVALVFEEQKLTYAELNQQANRLAHHLQSLGVRPEAMVGICLERSLQMVVAALAVLKAGGAYVPMDPEFPAERLRIMMEDARMPVLIAQHSAAVKLPPHHAQIVWLDAAMGVAPPADNPVCAAQPENLAYVIFTSGSTGRPKGVQIPHRGLANLLNSMRRQPAIESTDVLLATTTLSFDIAGMELFLPLIVGARVVLANRETVADGPALLRLLRQSEATVWQATPVMARMLLEAGWDGNPKLKILIGGEPVPLDLARALMARATSVWNMYGPTETTIWSTVHRFQANDCAVSIGRPIDNTRIHIVSADLQPVPIGVAGELLIGGDGLARGYLGQPELTAARFIPDPFHPSPGARLYRTGDLARYRPDGTIECLGRLDCQVKVRGYRIELGEIETVLRRHPGVAEAVVAVRKDPEGIDQLAAYVVPKPGAVLDLSQLRGFARETLPLYMLPSTLTCLEKLPLTPNGKVDRRALPRPGGQAPSLAKASAPPRTNLEGQLVSIWKEVLGVADLGIHDNFFDLGGHSLLAMRLSAEVQKKLGKQVRLAALFSAPTVAQYAQMLALTNPASGVEANGILRGEGDGPPLFFIPGGEGYGFLPAPVAQRVGKIRRYYDGLQYPGLDGKSAPLSRLEDVASALLHQIRSVCPQGPYGLIGYSLGGNMAFEIACQMRRQGLEIDPLILWDSRNPSRTLRKRSVAEMMSALRAHYSDLADSERLEFLKNLAARKTSFLWSRLARRLLKAYRTPEAGTESAGTSRATDPKERVKEAAYAAWAQYRPGAYEGRVVLFRIEDWQRFAGFRFATDPYYGWGEVAKGGVEVITVPGDHFTLRKEPNISILARKMAECLAAPKSRQQKELPPVRSPR